jgi:hypothetical protein
VEGMLLLGKAMIRGSTIEKVSARRKKNSRVSPCFLHLKILKTAFMGDMELWSSRH